MKPESPFGERQTSDGYLPASNAILGFGLSYEKTYPIKINDKASPLIIAIILLLGAAQRIFYFYIFTNFAWKKRVQYCISVFI